MELDDGHGDDDGQSEDQVLPLWKRRKRKIKWAQGKGIFDRAILFCHSRHLVGVSGFKIDSRTMKRGEIHYEMQLSKCH
jgi:hypothetical protein